MSASPEAKPKVQEAKETAKPAKTEKVWWVTFHAKSDPNQQDDVQLGVQGEIIVVKRECKIPLLDRFKVAAENATYPKFTQRPGEPRKQVGNIRVFPFNVEEGEATMEDWLQFRNSGTAIARKAADESAIK